MSQKTPLVLSLVCLIFMSALTASAALVVREEAVQFSDDTVRFPVKHTFVITGFPSKTKRACDSKSNAGSGEKSSVPVVATLSIPGAISGCEMPVPHFSLGSSELTAREVNLILTTMKQYNIASATPLHIIGHTCQLGKDQKNQALSLHRAKRVAAVLRAHGHTIEEVKGEGSLHPVTTDERLIHLNRRVEITK